MHWAQFILRFSFVPNIDNNPVECYNPGINKRRRPCIMKSLSRIFALLLVLAMMVGTLPALAEAQSPYDVQT